MKQFFKFVIFIVSVTMFVACENANGGDGSGENSIACCYYVLNSGDGSGNSSLTRYEKDNGNIIQDYFFLQNKRGLGNLPNDIIVYGSKMYIAVSGEMTVEVTDLNAKSIKQISCGAQPRYFAPTGGKLYVTYYDGYVARIDTTTLEVEAKIEVGRNPEQLAVVGNTLYVANSGGLDWNTSVGYDNTVSVIDVNMFKEIKKIDVSINPVNIVSDGLGVYVASMGNYGDVPSVLQYIDAVGNVSPVEACSQITEMCYMSGSLYGLLSEYNEDWIQKITYVYYNKESGVIDTGWIKDVKPVKPYKLSAVGEFIAVTSSDYPNDGDVYLYDKDGVFVNKIPAGLFPVKLVSVE